jgi:hypothetical protein
VNFKSNFSISPCSRYKLCLSILLRKLLNFFISFQIYSITLWTDYLVCVYTILSLFRLKDDILLPVKNVLPWILFVYTCIIMPSLKSRPHYQVLMKWLLLSPSTLLTVSSHHFGYNHHHYHQCTITVNIVIITISISILSSLST